MSAPRDDRQQLHLTLLGCAEIAADSVALLKKITMAFDGALGDLYTHNQSIKSNTTKNALTQGIALSPSDKMIASSLTQVIDKLVSINALIESTQKSANTLVEHNKTITPAVNTLGLEKTLAECSKLNNLLQAQLVILKFTTGQINNVGLDTAVANKLTASIDELIEKNLTFREKHLLERGLVNPNETPDTTNKKQFRS